jgi:glyoxylase-like metal-dependent hydrolase (beta-lactamase superfamily II)
MSGVVVLSTGRVRQKRGERGVGRYLRDEWRTESLPVHVALVEHPQGLCLFDTGQTAAATEPGYFPRWQPFFRLARFELSRDDEAASQLVRRGFAADDVRWVVLSHLHTDHVGGLGAFRHASVHVSTAEWERARGVVGRVRGYLPDRWPPSVRPTLVDYGAGPLGPFPDSFDLVGDGSLVLVPLPGHTPGHMGMVVTTGDERWLLAGDAALSRDAFTGDAPEIAAWTVEEGVTVLLTHDAAVTLD